MAIEPRPGRAERAPPARSAFRRVLRSRAALARRARRGLPFILVALLGLIPQWQPLPSIGGFVIEPILPIVLVALGSLVLLMRVRIRPVALVMEEPLIGVGAVLGLWSIVFATALHGSSTFSWSSLARMCVGLVMMWTIREVMPLYMKARSPLQRHLGLIAMVSVTALLFGPVYLMGGSPHTVIISAVTLGDSSALVYKVFRTAFRASGTDDALANTRHTLAATVAALVALSLAFPATSRAQRLSLLTATVLVTAWVLLSISRSTWLALSLPVLLFLALQVRRFVRTGRGGRVLVVVAALLVVLAPRLDGFLADRLGNTRSYEGRAASLNLALEALEPRTLTGGEFDRYLIGAGNPHNMVLTMWLGGGVLAALGGVMIALAVLGLIARSVVRLWRYPGHASLPHLPGAPTVFGLARAQLIISCLVLSRMMFGGGQTLHIAIWSILGIALGIDAYLRRAIPAAETRKNLARTCEIEL